MKSILLVLLTVQLAHCAVSDAYLIHRVTFSGSFDRSSDTELRRAAASIEEGKVYSAKALDRAISEINKLGMFRTVKRSDCRVTRSDTPGYVDIEIKLNIKEAGKSK